MANKKLTMLDVFRSCHAMNVDDVRRLFLDNFDAIIRDKDSKIETLERQLSAIQESDNESPDNSPEEQLCNADDSAKPIEDNNTAINNLKGLLMVTSDQLIPEVNTLKQRNEELVAENKRITSESEKKIRELSDVVDTQKLTIKSLEANNLVMSELLSTLRMRCNLSRDDQCNFD